MPGLSCCAQLFSATWSCQETVVRDTYPEPIVPFDLVSDLLLCQDNVKCDVYPDGDFPKWGHRFDAEFGSVTKVPIGRLAPPN